VSASALTLFLSRIWYSLVCENGLASLHTNRKGANRIQMLVCSYQVKRFLLTKGNNGTSKASGNRHGASEVERN